MRHDVMGTGHHVLSGNKVRTLWLILIHCQKGVVPMAISSTKYRHQDVIVMENLRRAIRGSHHELQLSIHQLDFIVPR